MQIFYTNITHSIQSENLLSQYLSFLSPDERLRLEATKLHKNKLQFLYGRVLLKSCLTKRLNHSVQDLKFQANENGRLTLEHPKNNISFSLSHSGDLVLLAVDDKQIGVDLEFMKERKYLDIADYFFEPEEVRFLQNNQTKENFYTLWTLKEAFIKCLGERLYSPQAKLTFNLNTSNKTIQTTKNNEYKFSSYKLSEDYIVSLASAHQPSLEKEEVEIIQVTNLLPQVIQEISTQSKLLYAS